MPVKPIYVAFGRVLRIIRALPMTCLAISSPSAFDFIAQAVLAPVGFIGHDHNIAALGKRFVGFREFLHRGENNAVRLSAGKQGFQVFAAFGVHGFLPQKCLALCKLCVKLIV